MSADASRHFDRENCPLATVQARAARLRGANGLEAGLALAAGVLGVGSDLPVARRQGGGLRKKNKGPDLPQGRFQVQAIPWWPQTTPSPHPQPVPSPGTHLPCRLRRSFFSSTHSRLFLTTPRLAILRWILCGKHSSEGTGGTHVALKLVHAGKNSGPPRGRRPPMPLPQKSLLLDTSPPLVISPGAKAVVW